MVWGIACPLDSLRACCWPLKSVVPCRVYKRVFLFIPVIMFDYWYRCFVAGLWWHNSIVMGLYTLIVFTMRDISCPHHVLYWALSQDQEPLFITGEMWVGVCINVIMLQFKCKQIDSVRLSIFIHSIMSQWTYVHWDLRKYQGGQ